MRRAKNERAIRLVGVVGFFYVLLNLITAILSLISAAHSLEVEEMLPRDFLICQRLSAVFALLLTIGITIAIHYAYAEDDESTLP